jgi:hypothetical protein
MTYSSKLHDAWRLFGSFSEQVFSLSVGSFSDGAETV